MLDRDFGYKYLILQYGSLANFWLECYLNFQDEDALNFALNIEIKDLGEILWN